MKLHKVGKSKSPVVNKKEEAKERKSHANTLPSDEYQPLLDPIRFHVNTYESFSGDEVKDYLEVNVKRFGEDDENAPRVFIQTFRESPKYTGYLKGKSVNFPINEIEEVIDALDTMREQIEEKGIK